MHEFRVRATGSGRIVDVDRLQQGNLVDASWYSFSLTAVLTNAITDAIEYCRDIDPECKIHCIEAPTSDSSRLVLEIRGDTFTLTCRRELARGSDHSNPFKAEDGKSYDVVFSIKADNEDLEDELTMELQAIYPVSFD